ncbi:glycoside hydrolase family 47 protein [Undibacterium sp. FT137W]|uniref:Glycoside hydrolase family 47 protein n=2 Tax=Undibacterium fentianense TaxID=2828728 RepID=A0A941E2X7_9BURK|nr:glycoside hydrolase family 47 protein [Undibacterium fentianense]
MGKQLFEDCVKYCRTDAGYAALKDVRTKTQSDSMESFVFAETFKYFYLIFAPQTALDFNKITFNTEAHSFLNSIPESLLLTGPNIRANAATKRDSFRD